MSDNSWVGAIACPMAALLLAACSGTGECHDCDGSDGQPCPTSPILTASADDGTAILQWEPAVGLATAVNAWQIQQAQQGERWSVARSTGPAATAYVVSRLTNDRAYTFQIRAQFDATDFGCWSTPVTVVPRRVDDVMKEIEKHQRAIAERMAKVVEGMGDRQELLRTLGEQGVAALGAVATSTGEVARHSAGIRDEMGQVAANLDTAGKEVAAAAGAVAEEAAGIGDKVEAVGQRIEERLAEIAEQVTLVCNGCGVLPDKCHPLGSVSFKHDNHRIVGSKSLRDFGRVSKQLADLAGHQRGLFLIVGYATPVGHAVHNLRLSNLRAACVSRCIDDRLRRLPNVGTFAFRELARGEVPLDRSDLAGVSPRGRRVDVTFCPDYASAVVDAERRVPVWPDVKECRCANDAVSDVQI